jgi:predicted outer membrane repeat protein
MSNEIQPRNRAERRSTGKRTRAAGAALTAGSAALAMGAAWIGTGFESAHAVAGTFTVTQATDTGNTATSGSLSWAIHQADLNPGSTIDFNVSGNKVTLSTANPPNITAPVTITGPGVTIDGANSFRPFYLVGDRDAVTISGLTITKGEAPSGDSAGAILNQGDVLTVSGVTLSDNHSVYGGAIASGDGGFSGTGAGSLTVENSTFTGNVSDNNGGGIGFYDNASSYNTLTVVNSTFSGNNQAFYGGGFYVAGDVGNITVTGSTFADNTATYAGAGFMIDDIPTTSTVTVSASTVSGNHAHYGAGVALDDADGGVSIDSTVFDDNHATDGSGGGLYAGTGENGLSITNSTFTNNTATESGGGFSSWYQGSDQSISGSTFSGNSADYAGGGFFINGDIDGDQFATTVTSSTISGNQALIGGGGAFYSGAGATVTDSTVSGNHATVSAGLGFIGVGGPSAVNNSTITGNVAAQEGGGVLFVGYDGLTVNQSTIVGNDAASIGGVDMLTPQQAGAGVVGSLHTSQAKARAAHTHSADAHAHGAKQHDAGPAGHAETKKAHAAAAELNVATIVGTILTGNTNGDLGDSGTATANHSILGVIDPGTTFHDAGGNQFGVDPMLGALANNGGPTMTMELLVGSPAINAGPDPVPAFAGNEFDQRGAGFPRVAGGTVDIGAFEVQPVAVEIVPKFTG